MDFLQYVFLGNTVRGWATAAVVMVVVFSVLVALKRFVLRYLSRLSEHTRTDYDDIIAGVLLKTKVFFIAFLSLYAGSRALTLAPNVGYAIKVVGVCIVFLQLALWGNALIDAFVRREVQEALEEDPASATAMNALGFIGRLLLYAVLLLMALANLDVEIMPLVAGLGVGGIAVALAVQNILGDLFASLSIVLDKPFVIGDFIVVDDLSGTVDNVGLKTTRVRSLSGEQLVFSNADLLASRIRNFKRMVERRVAFSIGVTYQTSYDQLAA
ncbi:MAG: mechanosensitive ion channel family protein, partial [Longimicrobiales bacterium]